MRWLLPLRIQPHSTLMLITSSLWRAGSSATRLSTPQCMCARGTLSAGHGLLARRSSRSSGSSFASKRCTERGEERGGEERRECLCLCVESGSIGLAVFRTFTYTQLPWASNVAGALLGNLKEPLSRKPMPGLQRRATWVAVRPTAAAAAAAAVEREQGGGENDNESFLQGFGTCVCVCLSLSLSRSLSLSLSRVCVGLCVMRCRKKKRIHCYFSFHLMSDKQCLMNV